MPLFDGHERPPEGGPGLSRGLEGRLDDGPVSLELHDPRTNVEGTVHGGRSKELDRELRGHRRRSLLGPVPDHHRVDRRPVAVAIEEGTRDAPVQDILERVMVGFWRPVADDLVSLDDALYPQSVLVRRPAAKANASGRIPVLEALLRRAYRAPGGLFSDSGPMSWLA